MLPLKTCSECGASRPKSDFRPHPKGKEGLRSKCRPCERTRNLRWNRNNRERLQVVQREWVRANPEKHRANMRQLRAKSPRTVIYGRVQCQMRRCLKGGKLGRSGAALFNVLGFTPDDLAAHIEKQFTKGMDWAAFNRGEIHIDHIRPLCSFQFQTPDDPQFREAWALTNLRPLWATDNVRKSAKRTHLI